MCVHDEPAPSFTMDSPPPSPPPPPSPKHTQNATHAHIFPRLSNTTCRVVMTGRDTRTHSHATHTHTNIHPNSRNTHTDVVSLPSTLAQHTQHTQQPFLITGEAPDSGAPVFIHTQPTEKHHTHRALSHTRRFSQRFFFCVCVFLLLHTHTTRVFSDRADSLTS